MGRRPGRRPPKRPPRRGPPRGAKRRGPAGAPVDPIRALHTLGHAPGLRRFGLFRALNHLMWIVPRHRGPLEPSRGWLMAILPTVFGIAGVHRFYMGQFGAGLIYLLTWGLCGLGTLYDVVTMRDLVGEYNDRLRERDQPDHHDHHDHHEAPGGAEPQVIVKETVREIVKVRCNWCGGLNDQGLNKCGHCGGVLG